MWPYSEAVCQTPPRCHHGHVWDCAYQKHHRRRSFCTRCFWWRVSQTLASFGRRLIEDVNESRLPKLPYRALRCSVGTTLLGVSIQPMLFNSVKPSEHRRNFSRRHPSSLFTKLPNLHTINSTRSVPILWISLMYRYHSCTKVNKSFSARRPRQKHFSLTWDSNVLLNKPHLIS